MQHEKHLTTYLNDHRAAATAGIEVAERCLSSNPDGPIGATLERFLAEIREERGVLDDLLEERDAGRNAVKAAVAWAGAKVSGLKPNDRLVEYSDLSRLVELETLVVGVRGKLAMWRSLLEIGLHAPVSPGIAELAARAERQLEELERHRLEAARKAFLPDTPTA